MRFRSHWSSWSSRCWRSASPEHSVQASASASAPRQAKGDLVIGQITPADVGGDAGSEDHRRCRHAQGVGEDGEREGRSERLQGRHQERRRRWRPGEGVRGDEEAARRGRRRHRRRELDRDGVGVGTTRHCGPRADHRRWRVLDELDRQPAVLPHHHDRHPRRPAGRSPERGPERDQEARRHVRRRNPAARPPRRRSSRATRRSTAWSGPKVSRSTSKARISPRSA